MKKLIRSIRRKPESTRDSIALILAILVTGIIFLIWLFNMPARMAAIESKYSKEESGDDSPGFSKLFEGIGDQFSNQKATNTEATEQHETETVETSPTTTRLEYTPPTDGSIPDWNEWADKSTTTNTNASSSTSVNDEPEESGEQDTSGEDTSQGQEVKIIAVKSSSTTASSSPNN